MLLTLEKISLKISNELISKYGRFCKVNLRKIGFVQLLFFFPIQFQKDNEIFRDCCWYQIPGCDGATSKERRGGVEGALNRERRERLQGLGEFVIQIN